MLGKVAAITTPHTSPAFNLGRELLLPYDLDGHLRAANDPPGAYSVAAGDLQANVDGSSHLHLTFPVAGGHSYDVQTCSTLTNWTTIATIQPPVNTGYDFIDTNFTGAAKKFYRLVLH